MDNVRTTHKKGESDIEKEIAELTSKMDRRTLAIWATDCAEHVLSYFEEKYSKDDRPRKAVEAGRAWVRGEISVSEARSAAFAAHAAATSHVARHAVHAANYAAIAIAKERDWQYQRLLEVRGVRLVKFHPRTPTHANHRPLTT